MRKRDTGESLLRPTIFGVPRFIFLFGIPLVAFAAALGLAFGLEGGAGEEDAANAPPATVALTVSEGEAIPSPSPSPSPEPATPTATAVVVVNRASCDTIRGTAYESNEERDWYRENCVSVVEASAAAVVPASAAPPRVAATAAGGAIRGSADRIVLSRLGIDAVVNYRTVGPDGVMGNPLGAYDTVWYDFANFRGLGGYPGSGGNAVIAGHVDYYGVGPAVFFQLRNVVEGDVIDYYRGDGQLVRYSVSWISDVSPQDNWGSIVASGRSDVLTLVTCNGSFDYNVGSYSHRRVVRAVLMQ